MIDATEIAFQIGLINEFYNDRAVNIMNSIFQSDVDYSWDELQEKTGSIQFLHGSADVSLRDIFYGEEEVLILAPNGKYYTKFHLPLFVNVSLDDDEKRYVPTDKASWDDAQWGKMETDLQELFYSNIVRLSTNISNIKHIAGFSGVSENEDGTLSVKKQDGVPFSGMTLRSIGEIYNGLVDSILYDCTILNFDISNGILRREVSLKNCNLVTVTCNGVISFRVKFENCNFLDELPFSDCDFANSFIFEDCYISSIYAYNCKFRDFRFNVKIRHPYLCNFVDSVFSEKADFRGSGFAFLQGLYRANLEKGILIDHEIDGITAESYFRKFVLKHNVRRTNSQVPRILKRFWLAYSPRLIKGDDIALSSAMRHVEGGCITLKNEMKRQGFDELAHRFYRFECWAKEYNPSTPFSVKLISRIYRGISFYGYEIIRPLIWIGWLWLLFSVIYLFVFFAEQPNSRALEWSISFSRIPDALSLSIGRLTPFIPWDDKSMDVKGTFNYVVRHADGANGLIVHMSAIAQTLISTGLLFLSGLAARRRFKLSD